MFKPIKSVLFSSDATVGSQAQTVPNAVVAAFEAEAREVESAGLRNMAWAPTTGTTSPATSASEFGESQRLLGTVPIEWLMAQPLLPFLLEVIPSQVLHRTLVSHGLEDSVEVIEWIRGEKLIEVLDYDLWQWNKELQADELSTDRVLQWLRVWFELSPAFAADRVCELEEETIVLLVSSLLEIHPEGIGSAPWIENDEAWTTRDGRFHLRMKVTDAGAFEHVQQLVHALYERDIKFAQAILSYSAMLDKTETLDFACRWRTGRMEDAGFVERDEALRLLRPRSRENLVQQIKDAIVQERARADFSERASRRANTSLSATWEREMLEFKSRSEMVLERFEPEDAARLVIGYLPPERKLLEGELGGRAPGEVLDDRELVDEAISGIIERCRRLLSKIDMHGLNSGADSKLLVEQVLVRLSSEEESDDSARGMVEALKGRIARVTNTFISAMGSRFDGDILERGLTIVRGCLNIGLEECIFNDEIFDIVASNGECRADSSVVSKGALLLSSVGPEFLFHLGWSAIREIAVLCARGLGERGFSHRQFACTLQSLVEQEKFADVRLWLASMENELSQSVFHVVESFLNRIPLYPLVLLEEGTTSYSSTRIRKPFERSNEIASARSFLARLSSLELK